MESQDNLESAVWSVEPSAILVAKNHWIWEALWWTVTILTLGIFPILMPRAVFIYCYAQTLGPLIGLPYGYDDESLDRIRCAVHEAYHVKQFIFFGWLVPVLGWFFGPRVRAWCGVVPMGIVYGLLPLPIGLAFGRFYLELQAEAGAWKKIMNVWPNKGEASVHVADRAEILVEQLCGKAYGFCLPKFIGRRIIMKRAVAVITGN